jgi:integrase
LEQEFLDMFASGEPVNAPRKFTASHSKPTTLKEAIASASGKVWAGLECERDCLTKLEAFLKVAGDKPLNCITNNDIDDLVSALERTGRSDATVNRYMSAISVFLKWCEQRGYRDAGKKITFDWREEQEGRLRWLSYEEEELMIQHTRGLVPLVIKVGIETGMRASEILELDRRGDLADGWVHLWKTKNGSARSVPISKDTEDTLRYLLDKGMPSYSHLRYEWDRAASELGFAADENFVFHACRHTFATRLVEANVNLRVIQRLMGHKCIETTMRYAHVHDDTLASAATLARTFHNSRRSVAGLNQSTQDRGLASVREGAKGPPSTDRKDTEVRGCDGAGVAELVDALVLGSDEDLTKP